MPKRSKKQNQVTLDREIIPWHSMKIKDIYAKLGTSDKGLEETEVISKFHIYGSNKLTITERFKILKMIIEQFTGFLVILLAVAGFISLGIGLSNFFKGEEAEEIIDAIAIFAIIIINAIIGFVQNFRSNQALEKLKEYFDQEVVVIRAGKEEIIHSCDLVPGDIVILEVGDKIPADCRLISANNLKIDEAPLTGESASITKNLEIVSEDARLHDRKNMTYSGTTCVYGRAVAVVVEIGMFTEIGKIAQLTQVKQELTPLQKALDKLGKVLGIIILVVCALVMVINVGLGESALESFEVAVALAISAVPEGLPAAIVITLAVGVSRMAKRKTIVSRLPAVETLGSVDYICSDKTGTLTRNEMTVKEIWTMDGKTAIGGSGYLLDGDFTQNGNKIDPVETPTLNKLIETAYNCNNAGVLRNEDKIDIKGDPTEAALVVLAEKAGYTKTMLKERNHEIFFDSERKRMTTINLDNGKKVAYMKGSPQIVLTRCNKVMSNSKTKKITKELEKTILDANLEMSSRALRVLGVAYKELPEDYNKEDVQKIENDLIFLGLTGMIDPARPEVKDAIEECEQAGITTVMITGDQKATAIAVAEEIGIIKSEDDLVVNGEEFSLMTDEELKEKINQIKVYSRMSPKDKYRVVETLQEKEHIVAVTGDGVNDAPALKKADIGVAMGITGTDVTKEVADMVITDDAFNTIVDAVEEGRNIFENMKKFIRYLLSCNFDEIFTVLIIFAAFRILPLLPLQILFLNLLTDALPALSLSFDPYDPELMTRPPRGKQKSFVKDIYVFAFLAGIVAFFATVSTFLIGYLGIGDRVITDWALKNGLTLSPEEFKHAVVAYSQMLAFIATLSFELWFVFIARNNNETPLLKSKPFKNKFLIGAVILSWGLLLLVIYIPGLQMIFSGFKEFNVAYLLSGEDWLYILGFTIGFCAFTELARYGLRSTVFHKIRKKFSSN